MHGQALSPAGDFRHAGRPIASHLFARRRTRGWRPSRWLSGDVSGHRQRLPIRTRDDPGVRAKSNARAAKSRRHPRAGAPSNCEFRRELIGRHLGVGRQRIEDGAIGHPLSVTSRCEIGEGALEPFQIFDFAAHVGDVLLGEALDLCAGERVPSGKAE